MHNNTFKLIVSGSPGVGKRTLIKKFIKETQHPSNIENNYNEFNIITEYLGSKYSTRIIIDTIGVPEKYGSREKYKDAHGIIIIFDISSIENCWSVILEFKEFERDIPILLVGNKVDIDSKKISKDSISEINDILVLLDYIECSSKTGQNVKKVFETIIFKMIEIKELNYILHDLTYRELSSEKRDEIVEYRHAKIPLFEAKVLWDLENQLKKEFRLQTMIPLSSMDFFVKNQRISALCIKEGKKFCYFPETFFNLTSLEKLDLEYNQIEMLPESIGDLSLLKELSLRGNYLEELPKSLINLKHLKELDLRDNKLERIPPSLSKIESLNILIESITYKNEKIYVKKGKLYLANRDIKDIFEIKGLDKLKNLRELNLFGNEILEIKNLENLINLEILDLRKNNIKEIKGLENFKYLYDLNLNYNQILEIKGLEMLKNLVKLHLDFNQISEIKGLENLRNLKKLYLNYNQIKEIKGLENLENLNVLTINKSNIQ